MLWSGYGTQNLIHNCGFSSSCLKRLKIKIALELNHIKLLGNKIGKIAKYFDKSKI